MTTAATEAPFRLTEAQLAQFDQQGYVVVEELFADAELQPVIDEITAEIDARARDLAARGALSRTYAAVDFEHRLARISEETDELAW